MKKNWIEKNTNDDSTDEVQITSAKSSEIVAMIDTILTISKVLAQDMRWLYQEKHINPYNNDKIIDALTDWSTHKDVMYLAGMYEGSKIAPKNDDHQKFIDAIEKSSKLLDDKLSVFIDNEAELKRVSKELNELLSDEDLTDEKLRDASEGLLPNIEDVINKVFNPSQQA